MKTKLTGRRRGPNDHHYMGTLLTKQEVNAMQHQFKQRIKTVSKFDNGALLVDFKSRSKNYTPSKDFQRAKSKEAAFEVKRRDAANRWELTEERSFDGRWDEEFNRETGQIELVYQEPETIRLPRDMWKFIDVFFEQFYGVLNQLELRAKQVNLCQQRDAGYAMYPRKEQ